MQLDQRQTSNTTDYCATSKNSTQHRSRNYDLNACQTSAKWKKPMALLALDNQKYYLTRNFLFTAYQAILKIPIGLISWTPSKLHLAVSYMGACPTATE
jgi:hypothetical protein